MGSATTRRFALVAAMLLLAPVWCRSGIVARATATPEAVFVSVAAATTAPATAIRRHAVAGWWLHGSRPDYGRGWGGLAVIALLSLLRVVPWSTRASRRSAPSALVRRRHTIALRAPPSPRCA